MDPDLTLDQLRAAIEHLRIQIDGDPLLIADMDRVSELWDALDTWLSRQGFLPADWARAERP